MLLDLLFPRRCVGCGAVGQWICQDCGRSLTKEVEMVDGVVSLYGFEQRIIREALHTLKYNGVREVAAELVELTKSWLKDEGMRLDGVTLVPVPVSKHRLKERGYNQAELLTRALQGWLGGELSELLERRSGRTLVGRSAEERMQSAQEAFLVRPGVQLNADVVVVDDVMTTGSTIRACMDLLQTVTTGRVRGLVVARKH